jgi:hypothetical protein
MVFCDLEDPDLRISCHNLRIASSILKLGFRVTERPADGQSAR